MIAENTMAKNKETSRGVDILPRKAALVAGFGLLLMFVMAMFSNFFVIEGLIVPGDSAATANNILANEQLFRSGSGGFLVVLICDVLVAWGLYVFFGQPIRACPCWRPGLGWCIPRFLGSPC